MTFCRKYAQTQYRYASLPVSIRFDHPSAEGAIDELKYFTRGRELCIRSALYRPFLYYAVHHPSPDDGLQAATLQNLVQKSLDVCVSCNSGVAMSHRHHGTWYGFRNSITAAFMIKAAAMGGLIVTTEHSDDGEAHDNVYGHALRTCVQKLRYWEGESPGDISRARKILEDLGV